MSKFIGLSDQITDQDSPRQSLESDGNKSDPSDRFPDNVVLLAGSVPGTIPSSEAVRFTRDADEACGLVVLFPGAAVDEIFDCLARSGRLAVPIADLSGGASPRADFRSDFISFATVSEAFNATQRIRDVVRSASLAAGPDDQDRLSILLLAASRQTPIEASWIASRKELIGYPLLHGIPDCRSGLEQLARSGLLKRTFFDRVHVCGVCGSARMPVREICTGCGNTELYEEALIHHYRCGYQALRTHFEQGQDLICPKCNRTLRHYGLDYDAPGAAYRCGSCEEIFSEPDVAFTCADCGTETTGEKVSTADWYNYELTSDGIRAALRGQLPFVELKSFVSNINGYRTPHDLAIMMDLEERVRRRYDRPFSIVTISFSPAQGMAGFDLLRVESMVWDIIRGALRETDFIAALQHQLVLLLPETRAENALMLVDRLNALLAETTTVSSQISVELLPDKKIPALVDIMRRL